MVINWILLVVYMDIIEMIKKEGLRRGFSPRTIRTYIYCVKKFLVWSQKKINMIKKKDIKDFLDILVDRRCSGNTINVYLNAIKFLFESVLNKKMLVKIIYSKTPKTFPVVLTKNEVVSLIDIVKDEKHRLMIELMYSSGLRVSELVNLRVRDLDFESGVGWVRRGKGRKDRVFVIANILKNKLRNFIIKRGLSYNSWLFLGRKGRHIHIRTIQEIVKKAGLKARILKNVHPHTLRHSFATHLIENGYDLGAVQSLLGHANIQTTMRYVHMANPRITNVRSPLDDL